MKTTSLPSTDCLTRTLAILGDKWTPLLISALSRESMRFCQLQQSVGGVNPRTLSLRLTRLEKEHIITKVVYPEIPPHSVYSITNKGKDLLPILRHMVTWGEKYHT